MEKQTLKLDKLRKEKNYTWIALSNATGIPIRTLQDINARESQKDITQIGSGVKKRLEKIADFWGVAYESLFEKPDDVSEKQTYTGDAYQKLKDFILYGENVSDEAKQAYLNILQERFTESAFETNAMNLLAADETEINGLQERTVESFAAQCGAGGRDYIAERVAINLTDRRFTFNNNVLLYFAMAFARNGFNDASDEIFQMINDKA